MSQRQRGLRLFQHVWALLRQHPSLLTFPLLGYLCKYAIFAVIITPLIHHKELILQRHVMPLQTSLLLIISFTLLLFVVNALLFFFNSAIIDTLLHYCRHQRRPSVAFGFTQALRNTWRVFTWALFTGTIGVVVNLIPRNSQYFQRIRQWLGFNHWQIASQFGLIYMLDQRLWPLTAMRRSSQLVQRTWGTQLHQHYALSWLFIICRLAAFVPIIIGTYSHSHLALVITSGLTIAGMLAVSTVAQLTYTTIRTLSYCQAQHQIKPSGIDQHLLDDLFIQR